MNKKNNFKEEVEVVEKEVEQKIMAIIEWLMNKGLRKSEAEELLTSILFSLTDMDDCK